MTGIAFAVTAESSFWEWVVYLCATYWPLFLRGAGYTLLISISGTLIGSLIGLVIGVIRTIPVSSRDSALKRRVLGVVNFLITAYVEIFRGTPMMVQAMVIFYGAAFGGVYLNRILAGVIIVSINTGAYMAEIVRGGIISIDKGQFEAAHSIGMTHFKTMRMIVLPQVIRNILPATGNEFVINIKDTSVLSVISVSELFFSARSIAGANFKFFEVFIIVGVVYFVLTFTVTRILKYVEKKLEGSDTYTIHGSHTLVETEFKVTEEHRD